VCKVDELAYVGIGAGDLDVWSQYAQQVLGQEVAADSDSSTLYLRMDERHHRFIVEPAGSEPEDVAYVGWGVRNAEVMDALAGRLEAAGVAVTAGTPEEAARRRVLGLVHFTDPHSGVRMELAYGPEVTFQPPFRPARPVSGFVTGSQGLGHFVTYVPDVEAAEAFYRDTLGFITTDSPSVPGVGKIASFMSCNPRHHSLAFFGNPTPRRKTYHVMLEHTSIDDVGSAFDICHSQGNVKVALGRHNNDRMFSFYAENPSGWLFELGWGARTIDPATFAVEHFSMNGGSGMGEWGHAGLLESAF
jgi:2,3-dihydroxybiphenyl 1,2-dioxygenase